METLVIAEHRNQYYGRVKSYGHGQSAPKKFREINCRTFHSGMGILPTPYRSYSTPLTKWAPRIPSPPSPRSPSPPADYFCVDSSPPRSNARSSPIPITSKKSKTKKRFDEHLTVNSGNLSYSELWAGPTYSNSPPPSSVPIPKFSIRPKRTVSLHLPTSELRTETHTASKSAPASPTRDNASAKDLFHGADSATQTLRRILNLDFTEESGTKNS